MDTKPMMCHDLAAIFEMVEFQNVKINSPSFIEICKAVSQILPCTKFKMEKCLESQCLMIRKVTIKYKLWNLSRDVRSHQNFNILVSKCLSDMDHHPNSWNISFENMVKSFLHHLGLYNGIFLTPDNTFHTFWIISPLFLQLLFFTLQHSFNGFFVIFF